MVCFEREAGAHHLLAVVSVGGGMSPQFRVQCRDDEQAPWRMFASYRQQADAEQCLAELRGSGRRARVICYHACPTAG